MAGLTEDIYSPEPISGVDDLPQLVSYLQRQLYAIHSAMLLGYAQAFKFRNSAPDKPFEGLTVGADGTNWNPGAGKGIYTYYSGAWNKLG